MRPMINEDSIGVNSEDKGAIFMLRWRLVVVACLASAVNGQVDCIYVPVCAQVNETPMIFVGRVLGHTDLRSRKCSRG